MYIQEFKTNKNEADVPKRYPAQLKVVKGHDDTSTFNQIRPAWLSCLYCVLVQRYHPRVECEYSILSIDCRVPN